MSLKQNVKDVFELLNILFPFWPIVLILFIVLIPLQINITNIQHQAEIHQAIMTTLEQAIDFYGGQAIDFGLLGKGNYTVVQMFDDHRSIIKQNIPTGDIQLFVKSLPEYLKNSTQFSI